MDTKLDTLPAVMTSTYKGAHEGDMVYGRELKGGKVTVLSECWPASDWDGMAYNKRDFALAHALASRDAEWPDTDPMNTTEYYTDAHGTWCLGCGNSVHDAHNPEGNDNTPDLVCASENCSKFAPDFLAPWVKQALNLA